MEGATRRGRPGCDHMEVGVTWGDHRDGAITDHREVAITGHREVACSQGGIADGRRAECCRRRRAEGNVRDRPRNYPCGVNFSFFGSIYGELSEMESFCLCISIWGVEK